MVLYYIHSKETATTQQRHTMAKKAKKSKKTNNSNTVVVTADAPRNYVFLAARKMTGKGAHGVKGYNRRAGKKVDFS